MKAAVIGAGAWGKNIVRTLDGIGALAAVAELDPGLRGSLAETYPSLTILGNVEALLETDIPAVCIAAPAPLHYKLAKAALESGKDVFVEKPMTLSVTDSLDLVHVARGRDRVLMVGHLLLYQPAIQWIRETLCSGRIGVVKSIHQRRLGLGKAREVENVLWSLGVHDVAVALYLTGSAPESIQVTGQRVIQSGIEDDVHLHMTFPGGVCSHLHCSWLWPDRERGMTIVGSEGMLVYNELEQTITLHRKSIGADLKNVDNGSEVVYQGSGEPLKLELTHFLECVDQRKTPISDGESGVDVVRVLETASERFHL